MVSEDTATGTADVGDAGEAASCFPFLQPENTAMDAASIDGKNFTRSNVKETATGFNGVSFKLAMFARSSDPSKVASMAFMDLERDGNIIEAGVWFLLSMVLLVHTLRSEKRFRFVLVVLVATLAAFGGSDLVEARTGAWWKPWWLFVWKAACVILLLFGFLRYFQIQKSKPQVNSDEHR